MPHIKVPEGVPGIRSVMDVRPGTAKPMNEFAQALMRGDSPLTPGERELIAAYTSSRNDCRFCTRAHSAAAKHLLGSAELVEAVKADPATALISDKMRALLRIAAKVARDARTVNEGDVSEARRHGATDLDIHDTVLVAAAFSMFNRYVDGLALWTPEDPQLYDAAGRWLAEHGYVGERRPK